MLITSGSRKNCEEIDKVDFGSERRKYKRISLSIPVEIKDTTEDASGVFENVITDNLSQGGLHLRMPDRYNIKPGESVFVHISVPREKASSFIFSRLIGKARVLRRERFTDEDPGFPAYTGLALEFDRDIISLAVAN